MNYTELGFAILKQRREKGLSQKQLAKLTSISRNYISMIERGEAENISVDILSRLANALDIAPAHLLQTLLDDS